MPPSLANLYQDTLLEHYRHPRNRGPLPDADVRAEVRNPLCGDAVEIMLAFDAEGRVHTARFEGTGCSISRASASMLTEKAMGLTRAELLELHERVRALLAGDEKEAADESLGDLRALSGVSRFPARVKCASLAWEGMVRGLMD